MNMFKTIIGHILGSVLLIFSPIVLTQAMATDVVLEFGKKITDETPGFDIYVKAQRRVFSPSGLEKDNPDYVGFIEDMHLADSLGNASAANALGLYYEGGFGGERDEEKARDAFLRSAERGLDLAKVNFTLRYFDSPNPEDESRSIRYAKDLEGVAEEYPGLYAVLNAVYALGLDGTPEDFVKARQYGLKCLEAFPEAAMCQLSLGMMYNNGLGGEADSYLAFDYLYRAAKNGVAQAQWEVGYSYQKGRGVTADQKNAFLWFGKAAEQNYTEALISYGYMCLEGQGTPQDAEKGLASLDKAAQAGSLSALAGLGVVHMLAVGVPENIDKGMPYVLLAAEKPFEPAVNFLNGFGFDSPEKINEQIDKYASEIEALRTYYKGAF